MPFALKQSTLLKLAMDPSSAALKHALNRSRQRRRINLGRGAARSIRFRSRERYQHIHQKGHAMENEISAPRTLRWRSLGWVLVAAAVVTTMGSCQRAVDPDAEPPEIGADWAVVQEFLDQERAWQKDSQKRFKKGAQKGKSVGEMGDGLPKPPDVEPALAAATAILNLVGAHEKTIEAAEFLMRPMNAHQESGRYFYIGAKALLAYAPDYQKWPRVLSEIYYFQTPYGTQVAKFFEEMASEAEDPVLRANGSYYVAAGMMRAANHQFVLPAEDREVLRQRAIEVATGLSAGVEEEQFLGLDRDGAATPQTLSEAEVELLRSLRQGTVGAVLPDVTGKRLDGVEERLSDYRGRIVLLDFWATWCGPCVEAFPKLRELIAKLPEDRFAIVAVSGDEDLGTVTRFIEDKPVPWTNWHAGKGSDFERVLRIEGYPGYVLVGEDGRILSRLPALFPPVISLIEKAVHHLGEFGNTRGLDVEITMEDLRSMRQG